jgi:hypothetical protein
MLTMYRNTATITDTAFNTWRSSIGLFAVDSNQVKLVSDTTVCRSALSAYNNALLPDSVQSTAVDVIRYGSTRYIVGDSARNGGEWTPHVVFDTLFAQVIASIGQ